MEDIKRLSGNRPLTVSLSGGNPAIYDFEPLIALGKSEGYTFACETQGSIAKRWFADLDTLVLSPKPPSSGEEVDWSAFERCLELAGTDPESVMKIVIFDDADFAWAQAAHDRFPDLPLYLQPGNLMVDPDKPVDLTETTSRLEWLIDKVVAAGWFAPRVLPQLHVMVWGNKRGV